MLNVQALGEFKVCLNETSIEMTRSHLRQLLVCLMLERGRSLPRAQLAEMLWEDLGRKEQLSRLRNVLTTLFQLLGSKDYIVRKDNRLAFNTQLPHRLDALDLLAVADSERSDISIDQLLTTAQNYQPLLPDMDKAWVVTQRSRLEDIYETKLLRKLLERLAHEQHWEKVAEWGVKILACEANRGVEPLYVIVMQAHYALDNLRGVSNTYERLQTDLDEMGLGPSKATRDLYDRMLREEEPKPTIPPSPAQPLQPTPPQVQMVLPIQPNIHLPDYLRNPPTPLIGRTDLVKRIVQDIGNEDRQLITLLGIGGIGKTRLAAAAALSAVQLFPDGVYFTAVDAARSEDDVYTILAEELHFRPYSQTSLKLQVQSFLQEKKLLLIIDNFETLFEHGLDGPSLVDELCAKAPAMKVLVTTRQGLQLLRERIFDVDGLDVPESAETPDAIAYGAVTLFGEIAGRVNDTFSLERELSTVIDICRALGGTPLAIEIAAALVRAMSCQEIHTCIAENLDTLLSSWRNVSPRQRSLRAVLDYAFSLLPQFEQGVFAKLSVFADGFTQVSASAVGQATFPALRALKDCALVRQDVGSRYHMHSFVRQFGQEQLADLGLTQPAEADLSAYFAGYAREHVGAINNLQPEWVNLLASMRYAHAAQVWPTVVAYADALCEPWYTQARYGDIRQGMAWACEAAAAQNDERAESRFLSHWGRACVRQGDYDEAGRHFDHGLTLAWKLIDSPSIARILYEQAQLVIEQGELDQAKDTLDQCIEIYEELNDPINLGEAYRQKARAYHHIDNNIEAQKLAERALEIFVKAHAQTHLPPIHRLLADIAQELRDFDVAQKHCDQALSLNAKFSNERESAAAHYTQALIYHESNRPDLAIYEAQQSIRMFRSVGDRKSLAHVTNLLGYIYLRNKDYSGCLKHLSIGLSLLRGMNDSLALIRPLLHYGNASAALKIHQDAIQAYTEGYELAMKFKHPLESAFRQKLTPD